MSGYLFAALSPVILFIFASALPAGAQEVGVTAKEIVIGITANLTGPNSDRSKKLDEGARIYFDKINKSGGVNGRVVRLVTYDDKYDPMLAVANTNKLINSDKVFLIFQPYGSAVPKALIPTARKYDVPLIFPFTGAYFLRVPTDTNIYNLRLSFWDEAGEMADILGNKGLAKEAGLIYQDDSTGLDVKNGFQKKLADMHTSLLAQASFPRGTKDVDHAVDEVLAKNPKAIVIAAIGETGSLIINKILAKEKHPLFLCASPCSTDTFPSDIKDKSADVLLFQGIPGLDDKSQPITVEYLAESAAAGKAPHPAGLEGYLNAKVLTEALKRAGPQLSRAMLRKVFNNDLRGLDISGLKLNFSPENHQGLEHVFVFKADKGKLVPYTN